MTVLGYFVVLLISVALVICAGLGVVFVIGAVIEHEFMLALILLVITCAVVAVLLRALDWASR